MKKIIIILIVVLLLSNGCWMYKTVDNEVTASYRNQQVNELQKLNDQLLKMIPALSANFRKEEVIKITSKFTDSEIFEKDGCVWIGEVGLKFNSNGKLEYISPAWSYDSSNPCFPE